MEGVMGKTIDTSELLYRMGKYAEIDVEQDKHDSFMHFMHLLTRTIEKMPNAALTHKNPIDDEIMKNEYKLVNAISLVTGRTRNDGWYPTWIGMTMKIVRLNDNKNIQCDATIHSILFVVSENICRSIIQNLFRTNDCCGENQNNISFDHKPNNIS